MRNSPRLIGVRMTRVFVRKGSTLSFSPSSMYPAFIDCKKRCHPTFSRCVNNNRSEEECECIQECPKVMKEVCGSDNVTYDNECQLKKAACEKYTEIEIVDKGPCTGM